MKALIFAAGLGTRLYPLTKDVPKALVKINDKPMISFLIHKLAKFGYKEFIVNVHHCADQLKAHLAEKQYSKYNIQISDESNCLLNTGGSISYAKDLLIDKHPVLVHNVDVFTDINYHDMLLQHNKLNSYATLAVKSRETSRYLLFDKNILVGWIDLVLLGPESPIQASVVQQVVVM